MKKNRVLTDHKKIGRKLIPPFFSNFSDWKIEFNPIEPFREIVPEIIWQVYLNNHFGVSIASSLSLKFLESLEKIKTSKKIHCLLSNLEEFKDSEVNDFINNFSNEEWYKSINKGLNSFNTILPYNPLYRFFKTDGVVEIDICKQELKDTILSLKSKRNKEFVLAVSNIIYYLLILERIKIPNDSIINELNKISDYPHTEESQILASTLRANIYLIIKSHDFNSQESKWKNTFWKMCNKLEPNNIKNIFNYE